MPGFGKINIEYACHPENLLQWTFAKAFVPSEAQVKTAVNNIALEDKESSRIQTKNQVEYRQRILCLPTFINHTSEKICKEKGLRSFIPTTSKQLEIAH